MSDRLEIPKFANEEEEANWWFENRAKLEEEFIAAAGTGRLRWGSTALRRARDAANALTIHLSDADLEAILAAQRGQDEDTCAASILHRALETETPDQGVDRH